MQIRTKYRTSVKKEIKKKIILCAKFLQLNLNKEYKY